jgi:aldehyde dehydrogenase (NAD+)
MTIAQDAIFDPVATVIPFSTEEAVRIANSSRYRLFADVHSRGSKRTIRVARMLEVGVFLF